MATKRKNRANTLFLTLLILILALAVAVVCLSVSLSRRSKEVKAANASISMNEKELDAASKKIADNESAIAQKDAENSSLQSALDAKEAERSKLEKENKGLESQIATLKAKRAAEAAAAKAAAKSSSSKSDATSSKPAAKPTPAPVPAKPVTPGSKVCYLTFDDGPSDNTLTILSTLKKYNAKATFFVTNNGKPAYMKNIVDAGQAIALHTATHQWSIYSSQNAYFNDLQKISDMVVKNTGVKTMMIRFPGGSSNAVSKKHCKGIMTVLTKEVVKRGYQYYDWNVDSGDASGNNVAASKLINNVLNGAGNKSSICVLMHDTAAKKTTVQALPKIIEGLQKKGFRFDVLTPSVGGFHHGHLNN